MKLNITISHPDTGIVLREFTIEDDGDSGTNQELADDAASILAGAFDCNEIVD